ncbi:MAG: Holliday junction branch migration protein RuvA, partial [Nitrospinota bacterium]
ISGSGVTRSVSREGDDAKSALIALGYKEAVAQKAVDKTLKYAGEELTVEEIIKESLKSLVR